MKALQTGRGATRRPVNGLLLRGQGSIRTGGERHIVMRAVRKAALALFVGAQDNICMRA